MNPNPSPNPTPNPTPNPIPQTRSFVGVAIAADVFMVAIEVITSSESTKVVTVNGVTRTFTVQVWNATVANLTLMALGSSAPEILLSVIEITTGGFFAGEL